MAKKLFLVFGIWAAVIVAYIFIAAAMPAIADITGEASTAMSATSNMTNYPGALEFVDSSPVWIWVIPGLIGVVVTAVVLKKD